MWTGHGRALHQCQDTLNSSERRQVAPVHSSSVVAVCKSTQCISPPIVLDCVPYIHFCLGTERHYWCNNLPARKRRRGSNRAQARYKTIERSVKTPIVQWRKCTICGTAMVLLWQNYGYGCCFFFFWWFRVLVCGWVEVHLWSPCWLFYFESVSACASSVTFSVSE